ncbi:hypothetical protein JCM11491_006688 [Sporobolomyces phaffii]
MGFCRRCGEIVSGDRCKCGGSSRDSTTKILFGEKVGDKWSQRYLARSSSPTTQSSPASISEDAPASPASYPSPRPAARPPPPSPSKLASEDTELSCVFGSVLSPKDHWQCSSCKIKFRQEEVIYPHPDAASDPPTLGELFYCRKCFAERFSLGNCKKCKMAVLSDAKFIKHEKNLWHEPCYVCSYCPNLSHSSIVIDFAARPSCEDCFDSFAYKTAGILPSPHLSQTEWAKLPVEAPPPPNKWGRPSMSGASSVWSSKTQAPRATKVDGEGESGPKVKASRIKEERENSPLVASYDELGDKLKRFGLNTGTDVSKATGLSSASAPTARPPFSRSSNYSIGSSTAAKVSPPQTRASTGVIKAQSMTDANNGLSVSPRRAIFQPLQPVDESSSRATSPCKAAVPAPSETSIDYRSFLKKTSATSSSLESAPRSLTPLRPSSLTPLAPTSPASVNLAAPVTYQETCPVCSLALGYGQFVELPSGRILHFDCFSCSVCKRSISGKYIELAGNPYHKECAPPPARYRAIVTSLAEHEPESPTSPGSGKAVPLMEELPPGEPLCAACAAPLGFGLSVTVPKSGQSYHSTCFTCATCSKGFEKGFVEHGGLGYHEKCLPVLATVEPATARVPSPSSPSRAHRPPRLPSLPSFPPKHTSPAPVSPSRLPPWSVFSTRLRPPSNLGGLLICTGCSVRATEKETVPGPGGRSANSTANAAAAKRESSGAKPVA